MWKSILMGKLLAGFFLLAFMLVHPRITEAGCGCDKPPPAPASVIPNVAFSGMTVTLFHFQLQVGQEWEVVFQNGVAQETLSHVPVVLRRDLTDPTGQTYTPQLVVALPNIPEGPTQISASSGSNYLTVSSASFTTIGKPVMLSEQNAAYTVNNYTTAVADDDTLYLSVGGLAAVCKPMRFRALMDGNPLRYSYGNVVVMNAQGFLIEDLDSGTANHFLPKRRNGRQSDRIEYWRHSFIQYCAAHQPGGVKEVDPTDPNWHRDGTPHVDYATLIFAISGHFDNGSTPPPGRISFTLNVDSEISDRGAQWEQEIEEEAVSEDH